MSTNSPTARQNFRQIIKTANLANIYELHGMSYADDITKAKSIYDKVPKNKRSAARSQAYLAAMKVTNSSARVLAFFAACARAGYSGLCSTNEETAEIIAAAKHCKLASRTYSRSINELKRAGFVTLRPLPTGNVTLTQRGYVTKRVNQVLFNPQLLLLIGENTYISIPSPKRLTTLKGKNQNRTIVRFDSDFIGIDKCTSKQGGGLKNSNANSYHVKQSKPPSKSHDCLNKVESTCPQRAQKPPVATIEHEKLNSERKAARKPLLGRLRKSKPLAWASLRLIFLSELENNLDVSASETERQEILKLARIQTAENFPPLVPTPVNWNQIIWQWKKTPWTDRRKYLRQILIPSLAAAVSGLIPPDRSLLNSGALSDSQKRKLRIEIEIKDQCGAWQQSISEQIQKGQFPQPVKEYAAANEFQLDMWSKLINAGTVKLAELDTDVIEMFETLADWIGAE